MRIAIPRPAVVQRHARLRSLALLTALLPMAAGSTAAPATGIAVSPDLATARAIANCEQAARAELPDPTNRILQGSRTSAEQHGLLLVSGQIELRGGSAALGRFACIVETPSGLVLATHALPPRPPTSRPSRPNAPQ